MPRINLFFELAGRLYIPALIKPRLCSSVSSWNLRVWLPSSMSVSNVAAFSNWNTINAKLQQVGSLPLLTQQGLLQSKAGLMKLLSLNSDERSAYYFGGQHLHCIRWEYLQRNARNAQLNFPGFCCFRISPNSSSQKRHNPLLDWDLGL